MSRRVSPEANHGDVPMIKGIRSPARWLSLFFVSMRFLIFSSAYFVVGKERETTVSGQLFDYS